MTTTSRGYTFSNQLKRDIAAEVKLMAEVKAQFSMIHLHVAAPKPIIHGLTACGLWMPKELVSNDLGAVTCPKCKEPTNARVPQHNTDSQAPRRHAAISMEPHQTGHHQGRTDRKRVGRTGNRGVENRGRSL